MASNSLTGLAPRAGQASVRELLPLASAPCLYVKGSDNELIVVSAYFDDLMIASGSLERITSLMRALGRFKMEEKGLVESFCGIQIIYDHDSGHVELHQPATSTRYLTSSTRPTQRLLA